MGDGPRANELKRNAGAGVYFTGYMTGEELATAYASSDIFAFASDTETFGNVVLEAMSCGLPVVAAAQGGVLDMVNDRTGSLARPGDPDSFASAIT